MIIPALMPSSVLFPRCVLPEEPAGLAEKTSKARPPGKTLSTDKNIMFFLTLTLKNMTFSSVDRFYFSCFTDIITQVKKYLRNREIDCTGCRKEVCMFFDDDLVLLEIAFFQECSYDWYEFQREAMFTEEIDMVSEHYDFTFEMSEREVLDRLTSFGKVRNCGVRDEWHGQQYVVIRDFMDNYAIYRFGFDFEEEDHETGAAEEID